MKGKVKITRNESCLIVSKRDLKKILGRMPKNGEVFEIEINCKLVPVTFKKKNGGIVTFQGRQCI